METTPPTVPPVAATPVRPRRRRWLRALVFNVVAVVVLLLALPHAVAIPQVREGIEQAIREQVPEVGLIVDGSDHEAGENPYFASQAGGH